MPLRPMNTASHPSLNGRARTASLSLRLTLFRTTALPTRLLTTKANLLWSSPLARQRITKSRFAALVPSRWIWECRFCPEMRRQLCIAMRPGSDAQLMAALEASSTQNSPPIGRSRAGTETVDSRAAALFGLICAFYHFSITCRADYMFSEFRKSSESTPSLPSAKNCAGAFDYHRSTAACMISSLNDTLALCPSPL